MKHNVPIAPGGKVAGEINLMAFNLDEREALDLLDAHLLKGGAVGCTWDPDFNACGGTVVTMMIAVQREGGGDAPSPDYREPHHDLVMMGACSEHEQALRGYFVNLMLKSQIVSPMKRAALGNPCSKCLRRFTVRDELGAWSFYRVFGSDGRPAMINGCPEHRDEVDEAVAILADDSKVPIEQLPGDVNPGD